MYWGEWIEKTVFTRKQCKEIKRKLAKGKKKINDIKAYRRLLAIHMRMQCKTNEEISKVLEINPEYVSQIIGNYLKKGLELCLSTKNVSEWPFKMLVADTSKNWC